MSLKGRRVLVTGAGGFIGSHLAERLVRSGARVRALVKYNALGSWEWLDRSPLKNDMEVVFGDVRERDALKKAFQGVDVVFHLAALIGIPYSYETPQSYLRTNVEGTLNVLQSALDAGAKVVHTSTSEVYGTARTPFIREDHPLQAQSPYAASKVAADKLAESYHLSFGLPVVTVRPFNTYGPRQSSRAVIPTIISQALRGRDIRLGNLSPTRDLNYVEDTVEGFVRAGESSRAVGRTINLGTGRDISVGDLAGKIIEGMGLRLRVVGSAERRRKKGSEVERLCADAGQARRVLGWKPRHSLEDGLRRTVEWMRENGEFYRPNRYAV
jgi:NAD dependent epimerase/dehydratase